MKKMYKLAGSLLIAAFITTSAQAQTMSDFENLNLTTDSLFDGSDMSGTSVGTQFITTFTSGDASFVNVYDTLYGASWGYWAEGWAYTRVKDTVTPNFEPAAFSTRAVGGVAGSEKFAIGKQNSVIQLTGAALNNPLKGVFVTNTNYDWRSMKYGDQFAKKFTNADQDWFKLTIKGYKNGNITDSVIFMLADFTHQDSTQDYIVDTWEYVDLSPLGMVDSVMFTMSSSDVGQFGINTPLFFAIDNFNAAITTSVEDINNNLTVELYPNPASTNLSVKINEQVTFEIIDVTGKVVEKGRLDSTTENINVSNLSNGLYFIRLSKNNQVLTTQKFSIEK